MRIILDNQWVTKSNQENMGFNRHIVGLSKQTVEHQSIIPVENVAWFNLDYNNWSLRWAGVIRTNLSKHSHMYIYIYLYGPAFGGPPLPPEMVMVPICICKLLTYIHTYIQTYIHTYIHTYVYIYLYIYLQCIFIYIYIYIYTHIRAYCM